MSGRSSSRRRSPVRLIEYAGSPRPGVAVQGSLALALDSGPPQRRVRPPLGVVRDDACGRGQRAGARLIALLIAEVLAGVRPYHHLAGRTTPSVFELLDSLTGRIPGRATPSLGTVRVCPLAPSRAEVAAVVWFGRRAQALALRLEHDRGNWRCAAIETTVPPR